MAESWETVAVLGTEEDAQVVKGFLEAHGLRVEVESLLFHAEPTSFGQTGEVRLKVPQEAAEEAMALLERHGTLASDSATSE